MEFYFKNFHEIYIEFFWWFKGEWSLCYKETPSAIEAYPNGEQQLFMKQYATAQIQAYEQQPYSIGWTFWSFKAESAPMWDYLSGKKRKFQEISLKYW